MFSLLKKSLTENIKIDKSTFLKDFLPKSPLLRSDFSSLSSFNPSINPNLNNNHPKETFNSPEQPEIKINYTIEDTRYYDGQLFSLTAIGTIFIYDIYSKKLKKIKSLATRKLKAKAIHINSLRSTLMITLFSTSSRENLTQMKNVEISFEKIKTLETIKYKDFTEILNNEEFLDSECYVQFDEYNKVILTRNILRTNKIWEFSNYKKNFDFTFFNLNEVRLTGGVVLVSEKTDIYKKYNIHIFDINNGKKLYTSEISFLPDKKIIFFEIIRNFLFIKQEDNYPLYINLINSKIKVIKEKIDNEALFMYSGNTNKFILVSLDRYLIFDINGDLLQKNIHNNLSTEVKQNDICSPINNYPFIICWHLAKVSILESESTIRGGNVSISNKNSPTISLNFNNSNENENDNPPSIHHEKNSFFEGRGEVNVSFGSIVTDIVAQENEDNNLFSRRKNIKNLNNNYYSPNNSENPNNLGFILDSSQINDNIDSLDGLLGEHQIDIIYMDDIYKIRSITFKADISESIGSVLYVQEINSIFFITCYGKIFEIKL